MIREVWQIQLQHHGMAAALSTFQQPFPNEVQTLFLQGFCAILIERTFFVSCSFPGNAYADFSIKAYKDTCLIIEINLNP
jgi:hypothetical protein